MNKLVFQGFPFPGVCVGEARAALHRLIYEEAVLMNSHEKAMKVVAGRVGFEPSMTSLLRNNQQKN
eukprot:881357-Amphidinium_carterae.1